MENKHFLVFRPKIKILKEDCQYLLTRTYMHKDVIQSIPKAHISISANIEN